ncbi:autotransporter outer membrane beta-barrel domain-containing protein [Martelella mediterranea]|uniref:autotransporter outer membrane beta-barrel domain-containing protein n=1 Tax=Martelella mediterranea TaxID=293089 RepID=UPI001E435E8E|nr:autotransporter outer membrane beta-barrel domain-containing protein [Martelella mediterranea]MCD1634909.1 autotransporter outer membrane beta-barrel domain-containing protein [Martelella mediterranea]
MREPPTGYNGHNKVERHGRQVLIAATSALAIAAVSTSLSARDAWAIDECGPPSRTVYCDGSTGSEFNAITYQEGLELVLDDSALVVHGDINVGAIVLGTAPATITATSYKSLEGQINAISVNTDATLDINPGTSNTSSMITGPLTATTTGRGNAVANIQGGTISVTGINNAVTALAQGSGDAFVNITGNASIEAENSKTAILANNTGSGAANLSMTAGNVAGIVEARGIDGSIDISGGEITGGIIAVSDGGDFSISLTGGTLTYLYDVFEDDGFDEVIALDVGGNGAATHSSIHIDGATIRSSPNVFIGIFSDSTYLAGSTNKIVIDNTSGETYLETALLLDVDRAGTATIEFNGGTLYYTVTDSQINAALSAFAKEEDSSVTIKGGTISAVGIPSQRPLMIGAQAVSFGGSMATVSMSGGEVIVTGAEAYGLMTQDFETFNAFGDSTISMTGGTLHVTAAGPDVTGELIVDSSAIYIPSKNTPGLNNKISVSGGTITATNANGILAYVNDDTTTTIDLTSGNLTVDYKGVHEGYGVAISGPTMPDKSSASGVTTSITIGSQMTLDASNAYYSIINLNDAPDNQMLVSTAGTVTGDVMLGGGPSSFTLSGGTLTGNVYGDYDSLRGTPYDVTNPGNDSFIWSGGVFNGNFYGQDGLDSATIALLDQKLVIDSNIFDGGPGSDTFNISGNSEYLIDGSNIRNWESMHISGGAKVTFTGEGPVVLTMDKTGNAKYGDIYVGAASSLSAAPLTGSSAVTLVSNVTLMEEGATLSQLGGIELFVLGKIESDGGTITLVDGISYGAVHTTDYAGHNGLLALDADLKAGVSDQFWIGGFDVSGATSVFVHQVGEAPTWPFPVQLIVTSQSVSPSSFELLTDVAAGAFSYQLRYGSYGGDLGFFLVPATTDEAAARLNRDFVRHASLRELIDAGVVLQPYVPLYEAYQSALLEMTRLPSLKTRSGGRYEGGEAITAGPALDAVWGRVGGGFDHFNPQSSTTGYDYDMSSFEMQTGLDGLFLDSEAGALIGGITAHYQTGEAKVHSRYGDSKIHPDGYGFGGTLTWFGANGFYTDAQAALTWYSSELKADDLPLSPDDSDAFGYALSLEAGQAFGIGDGLSLTPQAQLSFASVSVDSFTGAYSDDVDFDNGQSLLGRVGLSIEKESAWTDINGQARAANVYGLANLYYEFLGETTATVTDVLDFSSEPNDFTGEIGFGGSIDWQAGKLQYSAFAELTASTGFNTGSYGYGGNVGLKVRW